MKRSIEDTPIVLIGAGNLATNLAKALYRKGFRIVQVYSRTEESARELAQKVEAEYTSKTYGYIGISGEVEVNLHSVDYYRVPRSDNGQRRKIAGLEERINDSAEVVGAYGR